MFEETGILKGTRIDVMFHPAVQTKGLGRHEEKEMCLEVERVVKEGVLKLQEIQS